MVSSYAIFIIYEDGSTYTSNKIKSQKDVDKIPKDKYYECIKIVYLDEGESKGYSHVIYGSDYVYLIYDKERECLIKAQWDDGHNSDNKVSKISLAGVGFEQTEEKVAEEDINATFTGKFVDDALFDEYQKQCHLWTPDNKKKAKIKWR